MLCDGLISNSLPNITLSAPTHLALDLHLILAHLNFGRQRTAYDHKLCSTTWTGYV